MRGVESFLVVDFEATCLDARTRIDPQEIIEFPVLLLRGEGLPEVDIFHRYVRPVHHPKLSDFCTRVMPLNKA